MPPLTFIPQLRSPTLPNSLQAIAAISAIAPVLFATLSCSVLTEPERVQCQTSADCATLAVGTDARDLMCVNAVCQENPTWSCLRGGTWPTPEPGVATVKLSLRGLVDDQPVDTAVGRLCRRLDYTCNEPLSVSIAADENGAFTLELPIGFDGYIDIRAPGRVPGLYAFYPAVNGDREVPWIPMVRPQEIAQFAALGGHPVIEGRGHVMLGAYDCQFQAAQDVQLSSTDMVDGTKAFYLVGKLPSLTAPATDASGRGGIINLPPGPVTITGNLIDGRKTVTNSVVVRENTITYTTLVPAPR